MSGTFHVFSVNEADLKLRDHKKRRPHSKSKSGCLSCKARRVKCDQAKPRCLRCQRNGLGCSYTPGEPTALTRHSTSRQVSRSLPLLPHLDLPISDPSGRQYGTPAAALLHHFAHNWRTIFALPGAGDVLPLCPGRPHLTNAVLALAACHLRHHAGGHGGHGPPPPDPHRVAEHFRGSLALRDFRAAMSQRPLDALARADTGVLVLAAVLLNLLAFVLPADEDVASWTAGAEAAGADPSRSWVFSARPDRLGWLAVQFGLRPLLLETRPRRRGISLGPLLGAPQYDEGGEFSKGGLALLDGVPDAWLDVFGLARGREGRGVSSSSSEVAQFLFQDPLRLLVVLRDLEPVDANIYMYLRFVGTLEHEFRSLLYERDEKALWLFGYWLGLMCRFEHIWWCGRRVRRDFTAIVMWLRSCGVTARPGREGLLWTDMMMDLEDTPSWLPTSSMPSEETQPEVTSSLSVVPQNGQQK